MNAENEKDGFNEIDSHINNSLTINHDDAHFIRTFALHNCREYLGGVWKKIHVSQLHVDRITGGLSNYLYLCSIKEDVKAIGNEPLKVLLRIYGENHHCNSSMTLKDVVVSSIMFYQNLGPKLYGVMPIGRIEEYIPSITLNVFDLYDPDSSARIATILAKFHSLEMPIVKEPKWLFDTTLRYMKQIDSLNFTNQDDKIKFDQLMAYNFNEEFEVLRTLLETIQSPVVFCHNDLQPGNVLKLPDGKLCVIDFEYGSYNHRGYDFGNHFCEWALRNSAEEFPYFGYDLTKYPSREQQLIFIRSYLKEYYTLDINNNNDICNMEQDEEKILLEANYFALASHFFWSVWAICQAAVCMNVKFSHLDYALIRMKIYLEHKKQLLNGIVTPVFNSNDL